MSTATTSANGQVTDMKKTIDDQRAAEAAGRNLYQAFKASTAATVTRTVGWFSRLLDRFGIRRALSRSWQFVSPWLTKAGGVASRIGILPSLAFGVLTYRGRHWLLTVVPERAYRVVSYPFRLIAAGLAKGLRKLGYGQYADALAARWTATELWVLHQHLQLTGWLDDHHSDWWMRLARNGLFALLGLRVVAMLPVLPLKAAALLALVMIPTSEIAGGPDERYPDSIAFLAFDTVMVLLGRREGTASAANATVATSRAPKSSDLAREAGVKAEREAREAGANRIEARRIGQFTRKQHMEANAKNAQPSAALAPATA